MNKKILKTKIFFKKEDKNNLFSLLQKNSIFMFENKQNISLNDDDNLVLLEKVINMSKKYVKKHKIFDYIEADMNIIDTTVLNKYLSNANAIVKIDNELNTLYSRFKELDTSIKEVLPYKDILDVDFGKLNLSLYTGYMLFKVSTANYEIIKNFLLSYDSQIIYSDKKEKTVFVFGIKDEMKILAYKIKNYINIIDMSKYTSSITQTYNNLDAELINIKKTINMLNNNINNLYKDVNNYKICYDILSNEFVKEQMSYSYTSNTYYISGWINSNDKTFLDEILTLNFEYASAEYSEATNEETPPTLIQNSKLVKPFENITSSYSVPKHNELDPTPLMSVWYFIIFGLIVGDAGYGLLMFILFGLYLKIKKPKGGTNSLIKVFMYSSISVIIFGLLYGSFFGYNPLNLIGLIFNKNWNYSIIDPVKDPMIMLAISIGVGILHISCGLVLNIVNSFRKKEYHTALSKSFSWLSIFLGVGLAILSAFVLKNNIVLYTGIGFIGIGVLLIIIFAGYKKKIGGKVISAFGGLYGITGYLGDILSYARIFALSLSGIEISFTFNLLAKMVSPSLGGNVLLIIIRFILALVIFLVGHALNIVLSLLGAYVHTSRLQYIEFYGKFYEGEGYLFEPFSYNLKYIDKIIFKGEKQQ
ncbi:MAG: V-type ATP synthase subunit I [Acholeplasmatales bacterium]|jgi:V/A-type H+-transporting ATPase subunit I|nr:V-type ATP synthase subunit I [Acholeplasmatales bacterium]